MRLPLMDAMLNLPAIAAGAGMGLLISTLGAGGGLIMVPILVYGFDLSVAAAAGTSLVVVLTAAVVGCIGHFRRGHVRTKVAAVFASGSMIGAAFGTWLHPPLSDPVKLALFSGLLFIAATRMAFGSTPSLSSKGASNGQLVLLGLGIGVLAGLFGIGGGFIVVPCLIWGARLSLRDAVGTSLAIIALTGAAGSIAHILDGNVSLRLALSVAMGAAAGALLGAPLSVRLPERPLRVGFSVLVSAAGVYILVRSVRAL